MTTLEALEIVLHTSLWDCYNDEPHEWTKKETEAYELLKKALTPPTSDEVCEALSEHYRQPISYTNNGYKNGFHTENQFIIVYRDGKIIFTNREYFAHDYQPSTATLIGRFYENEVKGE